MSIVARSVADVTFFGIVFQINGLRARTGADQTTPWAPNQASMRFQPSAAASGR